MKTKLYLLLSILLFTVGCNGISSNAISVDLPIKEFQNNKLAAKKKYIGNKYVFVGTVSSIEKSIFGGKPYVYIGNGLFYLNEEDILNLHVGQRIKIEGTVGDLYSLLGDINFTVEDCHVVN